VRSSIDLNSDLGEGGAFDDQLLSLVTSANIACGFHAGDADTIRRTVARAQAQAVAVGAHPSLFDRENFGRTELPVVPEQVYDAVSYQLGVFQAIAEKLGVPVNHVKPHGALYNMAARTPSLADAVVRAVAAADSTLLLFGPERSAFAESSRAHGVRMVAEVFADRGYTRQGALVGRGQPGALLSDPEMAAERVLTMVRYGKVYSVDNHQLEIKAETVCVHGDTPGAVDFARALRQKLEQQGIRIRSPIRAADNRVG
jgi:UPF0271 protein